MRLQKYNNILKKCFYTKKNKFSCPTTNYANLLLFLRIENKRFLCIENSYPF